ncbi:alpha/beta-hydrolase [Polyplosphaeria fusca]|uniref:Alpha/beta-hydrolase n=1 Tax=Polyplosphaeria fusca TaxID=682080 RepID=A0A9P4R0B0_9PLEO|nr:alpha/beta-hydrolase [Polyplosphaeria fusca]
MTSIRFGLAVLAVLGAALADKKACGNLQVINEGAPAGKFVNVSGIQTYISRPSTNTTTAILHVTDIFGVPLLENQLLADSMAQAGYLTVMPDLFRGESIPVDAIEKGVNITAFLAKHPTSDVDSIIASTISYMRKDLGMTKIGGTGYCFGGKYVPRFLAEGKGLDAGFIAHPGFLETSEIMAIAKPITMAAGELDDTFNATARHAAEAILQSKNATYQLNLYSGAPHGFAVRPNLSVPRQKYAKDASYFQAVRWFEAWL